MTTVLPGHGRPRTAVAVSSVLVTGALAIACCSPAVGAGVASHGTRIRATLTEFHIALSRRTVAPGTYTFTVRNAGTVTHALTVDGKGVDDRSTPRLRPGRTVTMTVRLRSGTYEVFCPVGDHRMAGMNTTIRVH